MTNNGLHDNGVARIPKHVAIIMDGNGRWAKSKALPRVEGHRAGGKTVRKIVEHSRRLGIRYLSLYAFSSENWQRPKEEVWALMKLFEHYLSSEKQLLLDNSVRLRIIGNRERLSDSLNKKIDEVELATKSCTGMDLILAISYGSREELTHAAKHIASQVQNGSLLPEQITDEHMQAGLYAPDVPDPDLLIRTSAEFRISNFLLWQLAYAEIVVSPVYWPDFDEAEYLKCLECYATRNRRYGLTAEQLLNEAGSDS